MKVYIALQTFVLTIIFMADNNGNNILQFTNLEQFLS